MNALQLVFCFIMGLGGTLAQAQPVNTQAQDAATCHRYQTIVDQAWEHRANPQDYVTKVIAELRGESSEMLTLIKNMALIHAVDKITNKPNADFLSASENNCLTYFGIPKDTVTLVKSK